MDSRHYKRVFRNQGWISPVILLNGRIIGMWSSVFRAKRWSLKIERFAKLSGTIRGRSEEEAASLEEFLETPVEAKFNS